MKLFTITVPRSRNLPRFIEGIYWATGLFLTTSFTEGCAGVNKKASPPVPSVRNRLLNTIALFVPLQVVQFSSVQINKAIVLHQFVVWRHGIGKLQFWGYSFSNARRKWPIPLHLHTSASLQDVYRRTSTGQGHSLRAFKKKYHRPKWPVHAVAFLNTEFARHVQPHCCHWGNVLVSNKQMNVRQSMVCGVMHCQHVVTKHLDASEC